MPPLFGNHALETFIAARHWQATQCTIVHSDIAELGDEPVLYTAHIKYTYAAGGEQFVGEHVRIGDHASAWSAPAAELTERYPVGGVTACWVNPKDLTDALLDRSAAGVVWPLLGLCIGLLMAFAASIRHELEHTADRVVANLGAPSAIASRTLRANQFAILRLITRIACVLLFVTIAQSYSLGVTYAWRHGELVDGAVIVMALMLVPVAVSGIFAVRSIIALRHPPVTLVLTPGSPRLGEPATIRWHVERPTRVRSISITLSSSHFNVRDKDEDPSHSYRARVLDMNRDAPDFVSTLEDGSVSFTLPRDGTPTTAHGNYDTTWNLELHVIVDRAHAIEEDWPIYVRCVSGFDERTPAQRHR